MILAALSFLPLVGCFLGAGILGFITGWFLNRFIRGPILWRDWNGGAHDLESEMLKSVREAAKMRRAEYDELAKKNPEVAKYLDEVFGPRQPSLTGK